MRMDKMTSLVMILGGLWLLGGATVAQEDHLYEDVGLNDKVFADNITFESPAKHELDCARQCSERDSCVTFTFHDNTCRGHGALMTSCSNFLPVSEARTYNRKKKLHVARCEKTGVTRVRDPSLGLDRDVFCQDDWMVFQKRQDGSVDFFRDWDEYSTGFGDVNGEYWLGLDSLHSVTTSGVTYDLRVDLMTLEGTYASAFYSNFSVGSAADNYTLHYDSFLGGNAGDALYVNLGEPFSTLDADHDDVATSNMAILFHGPWWYGKEWISNLNGRYNGASGSAADYIYWGSLSYSPLKTCQMMIRRAKWTQLQTYQLTTMITDSSTDDDDK